MYGSRGYSRRGFGFGPGALSPFIKWIIIANVAIFLLQNAWPQLTYALGLTPSRFFSDFPNRLYQVVTYMFLHGGFGHIFYNMFALWMFGTEIEYTWGSRNFARFYLIGGLAGAFMTLLVAGGQQIPTIGASAAIYSVFIAYWLMFPNRYVYLWFVLPIKVKWFVPGFMLLGFLFAGPHIAHWAHLGGALWGLAYLKLDWRWVRFGRSLKSLRLKHKEAKLEKRRKQADDVMKKVDRILDKINDVGIENLTAEERRFLEEASSELADRQERSENSR